MAKKGHSAASRRQAAHRAATNNVQRSATIPRESRPERTQAAPSESMTPKRTVPRTDAGRISKEVVGLSAKVPETGNQYAYVLNDLKQLGIVAAAMFAVLIVLSFIIH